MTIYWLTPLLNRDPFIMGSERMKCHPADLESFRSKLSSVFHPRLLMLFKASTLVSDEEDICGNDGNLELKLDARTDIVFNESLPLSHCAVAFLDRLLTIEETRLLLNDVSSVLWDEHELGWFHAMKEWNTQGYDVIIVKED